MYTNRTNPINDVKEVKTTTTTTVIQTKIEKPTSTLPKRDYGNLSQTSGRTSQNADKPVYKWSVVNHRFELDTGNNERPNHKDQKKPEVKTVNNNTTVVTRRQPAPNISTTVIKSTSKKKENIRSIPES